MKTILTGVDLRVGGHDWLVQRAAAFAQACDGRVDLIYVGPESPEHRTTLKGLIALVPASHRGKTLIEPGGVVDTLATHSRHYDAMVLGPREPGALERLLLGTMATRVIRRAECAVYIPRTERFTDSHIPRLLLGVDLRQGKPRWLVTRAGAWASALGGRLDAVFAEKSPALMIHDASVRAQAEREWAAAREVDRTHLAELIATDVPTTSQGDAVLGVGVPDEALVAMSELYDLVVVGNREAGIADLLLGSVTSEVVRRALCDVLTLPSASA